MEKWSVYKHTSPSGKVYIGITKRDPIRRFNNGKGYKTCPVFYKAILKYGWDNITHEILHKNLIKSEAIRYEMHYIALYKKEGISYNITDGGQGTKGAARYGIDSSFYGKNHTNEAKYKISSAQQGEKNNMFGTKSPCAIKINGKYLTEYAEEINIPYKRFYNYYYRHGRDLQQTLNFYKNIQFETNQMNQQVW